MHKHHKTETHSEANNQTTNRYTKSSLVEVSHHESNPPANGFQLDAKALTCTLHLGGLEANMDVIPIGARLDTPLNSHSHLSLTNGSQLNHPCLLSAATGPMALVFPFDIPDSLTPDNVFDLQIDVVVHDPVCERLAIRALQL
jgi:hypothetical protein